MHSLRERLPFKLNSKEQMQTVSGTEESSLKCGQPVCSQGREREISNYVWKISPTRLGILRSRQEVMLAMTTGKRVSEPLGE